MQKQLTIIAISQCRNKQTSKRMYPKTILLKLFYFLELMVESRFLSKNKWSFLILKNYLYKELSFKDSSLKSNTAIHKIPLIYSEIHKLEMPLI